MKKILVAAAAGAMMFGLTAASASTLNLAESGWFTHTVQQSELATATCQTGPTEVAIVVDDANVNHMYLKQQTLQGCLGSQAQVVATMADGTRVASNKTRMDTAGLDWKLTFNRPLIAKNIQNVRVTIADQIDSPVPSN